MKKTLLIGAAVAVGFSAFAQNNRQAVLSSKTLNKSLKEVAVEPNTFPSTGSKKVNGLGSHKSSAVCSPMWLSAGPNAFGFGGGVTTYQQNVLSYNKDLNSYVMTHRRSPGFAASVPMSSGSMQSTWMNATTMAKDSTILYYEPATTQPGRYPGGTFYNPAGNTTISNVYVVGAGPCLIGGSGFTGVWWADRKLTGTAADQTAPGIDLNYSSSPSNNMGSTIFMNRDAQQVGTKVYISGEAGDTTTSANANFNNNNGGIIGKFDGSAATWSRDSIIPGYYYDATATGLGYGSQGMSRLAFFGQTGYWVDLGRLATNFGNSADSMLAPIVYKTTNGGTTWTRVLDGYDWRCKHPELMKNVGLLSTNKPRHFTMNFKHGIDVTVDANGALHLVGTMVNMVSDGAHTDSAAVYSLTYTHDNTTHHPVIWDLVTDGNSWKTMMVDSLVTAYVGSDPANDTTASYNAITNGSTFLPYGARVQVSRSDDGTKIFYSWADSDPSVTGTVFNSQPDLFVKGYDVTSNKLTTSANVTNGIATCFFHMMADVSYFDATGSKWHVPMMYTVPRTSPSPGVYDGTSASDYFYVDCASYAASDFSTAAVWNQANTTYCLVGIESHNNFFNSVNAYPNPFVGSTNIVVNLNEAKAINVNVFDAIGNVVYSKKANGNIGENTIVFDGSSLTAGVYYYTVTAGYEKVTKKLVIQK